MPPGTLSPPQRTYLSLRLPSRVVPVNNSNSSLSSKQKNYDFECHNPGCKEVIKLNLRPIIPVFVTTMDVVGLVGLVINLTTIFMKKNISIAGIREIGAV